MAESDHYTCDLLIEQSGAIFLQVHAVPGATRDALLGIHDGRLKVAVTAAPEKSKANVAVCRTVASALKIKRSQVAVYTGMTSRKKRLRLDSVSRKNVLDRLTALGVLKGM